MEATALQTVWFAIWALLWTVYFSLDGFVLGSGLMSGILARNDTERRQVINAVGPVWDGNEVWLLTAGGSTFAAFPLAYSLLFSNLYTAFFLLLVALIFRGVSFEFRGKVDNPGWKRLWDRVIVVSSFLPALLFGVAFGNIFEGLKMRNDFSTDVFTFQGGFLGLLNPYALLAGLLFLVLFAVHGSLYLSVKTDGELSKRAASVAGALWWVLLGLAAAFLAATWFATGLASNYRTAPALFVLPALAVAALVSQKLFLSRGAPGRAFAASLATVATLVASCLAGLFPYLLPSSLDKASGLSIMNSSSSPYTLTIMTVVACLFVPVIVAYKIWVYRTFRAPVTVAEVGEGRHPY